MIRARELSDVAPEFAARVLRGVPLSRHTSWHVGGPADLFFVPRNDGDLSCFLRSLPPQMPVLFLGLGSNLLVRDGGWRGAVICTHGALGTFERLNATRIEVGAGVACARIARQCVTWGLGPAEFLAGIPGTLGGALAMNAGAWGEETWRHVIEVGTVDHAGERRTRLPTDFRVGYRHVEGPAGEWFTRATLEFERRAGVHAEAIRELLERRKQTQPIGQWSGGSTFVNPPGEHAARLIESAGLKGHRIGGACVSQKHANFIINEGSASAADIEALIRHVQQVVQEQYGIALECEVRIVGEAAVGRGAVGEGAVGEGA